MLGAPIPSKALILYIVAQEWSLEALCIHKNEEGTEVGLYYLSRTLARAEVKLLPIEKICLSLVFSIQKLKQYMQFYTLKVVSKADPIKYILSRPILSGWLAKWAMILKQHDLVYVPWKTIKAQALADFLAYHPIPDGLGAKFDLLGEDVFLINILPPWEMYVDRATRNDDTGAGVVLVSLEKHVLTYSFMLTQVCSNNMVEHKALILGL